jgi:hypothetical protein
MERIRHRGDVYRSPLRILRFDTALPRATTHIGSGYDHITSSMGAAMIGKARFDRADGDQAR